MKNNLIRIALISGIISIIMFLSDYKNREPDVRVNLFIILIQTLAVFGVSTFAFFIFRNIFKKIKRDYF